MLWILPTWLISLIAVFFLGYHFRGLTKMIESVEVMLKSKADKPVEEPEEPKSEFLDPDDLVQQAKWEHEEMLKKLNP